MPPPHPSVDPAQSSAIDARQFGILGAEKVDKLGCARIDGAARALVGGNDQLGKPGDGLVLPVRKKLPAVAARPRLSAGSFAVDQLRGGWVEARGVNASDGDGERRPAQQFAP